MKRAAPVSSRDRTRAGILSMELVLVLPIFLVVLFAIVEFSLLGVARANVVDASRAGVRMASLRNAGDEEIRQSVLRVLQPRLHGDAQIEIQKAQYSGDPVRVVVRAPMHDAAPDLLWAIGYSLRGRTLVSAATMLRE